MNIHCKLPCYVFYISLLTYFYKYQKYKAVELGDQLGPGAPSKKIRTTCINWFYSHLTSIFEKNIRASLICGKMLNRNLEFNTDRDLERLKGGG